MDNKEFDFDKMEEDHKKISETFDKVEYDGKRDILKYFDRIHDKLFNFNNILIAGFFTLSNFKSDVIVETILFPLINLVFLIYIEYKMMEKSRFESQIKTKNIDEINKNGNSISKTNKYSLNIIFSTSIVMIIFLYNLFK
ncbi:hypothetical protein HXZ94_00630 [Empedobacter falsenii]|uniref:hypothetical protein n=1 Tax=Empedobacter falsenii TaxID=343874 RepID=UPI0025779087|nr:hypothetical protein [Empedobacter falsenii]MDM1297010.1 hypothetical protein [Empedobacter falsenii]MDM1316803.1 hypothetical protein [Empedobacter falsenii]